MSIAQNLTQIKAKIEEVARKSGRNIEQIKLLPVTKSVDNKAIQALCDAGCTSFGENRIEVLNAKADSFDKDIIWHFIGTLQRKKIRKILAKSQILHSVESLALAEKISQVAIDLNITVKIFLEINNGENQKGGFVPNDLCNDFEKISLLQNIQILGFMIMAPFTTDEDIIRESFKKTRLLMDKLNNKKTTNPMTELSMGMSNDYHIAIEEGATLVRVGSALFQ
jgi:pyridoxal phosphate enzyme (YggS family)